MFFFHAKSGTLNKFRNESSDILQNKFFSGEKIRFAFQSYFEREGVIMAETVFI